ncbi:MAG: hypothetical protein R2728_13050 [Chitinophagales bacterium]
MKLYGSLFLALLFSLSLLFSCNEEDGISCTLEFRTIGLTVIGDSLTDYYTIRRSNNDTIRSIDFGFEDSYYVVLDDSYQSEIENSQESFEFIGEINDSIVIQETYVITADQCHISKISGPSQVTL